MMMPCFSKGALNKVLSTFNDNKSGWGIDLRWESLIHNNHKKMAIIDSVSLIHTRPVKENREDNFIELQDYIAKHNLNRTIKEYDYKCQVCKISEEQLIKAHYCRGSIVTNLEQYGIFFLYELNRGNIKKNGLQGKANICLFFSQLNLITESRFYIDVAKKVMPDIRLQNPITFSMESFLCGTLGIVWANDYINAIDDIRNNEQVCTLENCLALNYDMAISDNELSIITNQPIYRTMIDMRPLQKSFCRRLLNT